MKKLIFALLAGLGIGFASMAFAITPNGYFEFNEVSAGKGRCVFSPDTSGSIGQFGYYYTYVGTISNSDQGYDGYFCGLGYDQQPENKIAIAGSYGLDIQNLKINYNAEPLIIQNSQLADVMANILSAFGLLVGVLVLISGTQWGIKFIKKLFPNAY